jgi:hypothetical protein
MTDYRTELEHDLGRVEPATFTLDDVIRRRDRKRRNQRIAAGVVGIAVFVAAVWIVTSVGSFDRTQTPAVPGGVVTGPTGTRTVGPDAGWDGVGFPPEGTAPSTPNKGKLVAYYDVIQGAGYVYVYADGRVISYGGVGNSGREGIYERRLTPEGVELVRSGAVKAERFQLSSNPVPADAWEDPEARPYVPARYAICYWMERGGDFVSPSTVLRFFPAQAREILAGKDHTYPTSPADQDPFECSEVTTDEARALDNILRDVRVVDAKGDQIAWEINTLLPHGEWGTQSG